MIRRSLSFWQIKGLFGVNIQQADQRFLESYLFVSIFGFHAGRVEFKTEDSGAYQYQGPSRLKNCTIFSTQWLER